MKFRNKKTGSILEPNSKITEDLMKKSDLYEEVKAKAETKTETKAEAKAETKK